MKTIFLLFIFGSSFAFGLDKTSFKLNIQYDGITYFLEAGYSDSTSLNYDEGYENDLPPFAPPQGIIPTYRIMRVYEDRADELIYTDIDLRATPQANDTIINYTLDLLGNREQGKELILTVPVGTLDDKIKEIRVTDKLSEGGQVDENIINGVPFKIENDFLERFDISVRYVKKETSVDNNAYARDIYYSEDIIYNRANNANRVAIYSLNGTNVLEIANHNGDFNVNTLESGVYFAYIYSNDLVVSKLKIVKL